MERSWLNLLYDAFFVLAPIGSLVIIVSALGDKDSYALVYSAVLIALSLVVLIAQRLSGYRLSEYLEMTRRRDDQPDGVGRGSVARRP
jgi:hypothetical protein